MIVQHSQLIHRFAIDCSDRNRNKQIDKHVIDSSMWNEKVQLEEVVERFDWYRIAWFPFHSIVESRRQSNDDRLFRYYLENERNFHHRSNLNRRNVKIWNEEKTRNDLEDKR